MINPGANLYFEISDYLVDRFGAKYLSSYNVPVLSEWLFSQIIASSDRVWQEDKGVVRFVKNRQRNLLFVTADLDEFIIIKLKSTQLKV